MAARRRYTTKQRAEAVGIAVLEGVTETERQLGIPKETIQRWVTSPECAQLRTRAREDIVADVRAAFLKALDRTAMLIDLCDDLRDVSDTADKLGNRYALMAGEATIRTESRTLTEGLDDHERLTLRNAIDAWTSGGPASPPVSGDPGGTGSELREPAAARVLR
jgi:transposase-like protein